MKTKLFKEFENIKYHEDEPEREWTWQDELNDRVIWDMWEWWLYSFFWLKNILMKINKLNNEIFEDNLKWLDLTLDYLEGLFREKIIKIKIIQEKEIFLSRIDEWRYYFPEDKHIWDKVTYKVKEYIYYWIDDSNIINEFRELIKDLWIKKYNKWKSLLFEEFWIIFTIFENDFWY